MKIKRTISIILWALFAVLLLYLFLSKLVGIDFISNIPYTIAGTLLPPLLAFWVLLGYRADRKKSRKVLRMFLVAGLICAALPAFIIAGVASDRVFHFDTKSPDDKHRVAVIDIFYDYYAYPVRAGVFIVQNERVFLGNSKTNGIRPGPDRLRWIDNSTVECIDKEGGMQKILF